MSNQPQSESSAAVGTTSMIVSIYRVIHQWALYLLAPWMVIGIVLHLTWGLVFAVVVLPLLPQGERNRLIRFWSRILLVMIGVRVDLRAGAPDDAPGGALAATGIDHASRGLLLVANHTSWLDIYAINAIVPTRFIAKAEIARWPVVGALVGLVGTLFVERGRRHAVAAINRVVAERLAAGETIGIFPEGTTTDGTRLLAFHANLIQPALDERAAIRPLAIRYTQDGAPSAAACFIGDMTLLESLWRVMTAPRLTVEVNWLPSMNAEAVNRHTVARAARMQIAAALGIMVDEHPGAPASAAEHRTEPVSDDDAPDTTLGIPPAQAN